MRKLGDFRYTGPRPDTERALSHLERIFWDTDGRLVNKWHPYLPLYERCVSRFQGLAFEMLEKNKIERPCFTRVGRRRLKGDA